MGFLLFDAGFARIGQKIAVDSSFLMCGLRTGRKDVYGAKQMSAHLARGFIRGKGKQKWQYAPFPYITS
jgi:hypothetical protein